MISLQTYQLSTGHSFDARWRQTDHLTTIHLATHIPDAGQVEVDPLMSNLPEIHTLSEEVAPAIEPPHTSY